VVPPHGSAPRSIGYRPIALLLSYGGMKFSPTWTRTTTIRLTGGHATLTSSGNGARTRICTRTLSR